MQLVDLPSAAYHALDRVSSTRLKCFGDAPDSPVEYTRRYLLGRPEEVSSELIVGGAIHALALEGRKAFDLEYVIGPPCDRRYKAGKEIWSEFLTTVTDGRQPIRAKDFELVSALADTLRQDSGWMDLLAAGTWKSEQAILFEHAGVACKCKPDLFGSYRGKPTLVDLKTLGEPANPISIKKAVLKYQYHMRLAFYLIGLDAEPADYDVVIVGVGKRKPHGCHVHIIPHAIMAEGRRKAESLLSKLSLWLKSPDKDRLVSELSKEGSECKSTTQ